MAQLQAEEHPVKMDYRPSGRPVMVAATPAETEAKMFGREMTDALISAIGKSFEITPRRQAEPDQEMRILTKLVEDIAAAGYAINVIDGTEDDGEKVINLGVDPRSILKQVCLANPTDGLSKEASVFNHLPLLHAGTSAVRAPNPAIIGMGYSARSGRSQTMIVVGQQKKPPLPLASDI